MSTALASEAKIRSAAAPIGTLLSSSRAAPLPHEGAAGERGGFALLDRIGSTVRLPRDRAIFFEGDSADHYFKVLGGTVRLFNMLSDGRRQIIAFVSHGGFFGFSSAKCHAVSAEAVSDVTLVRYPRRPVDRLVASDPALARLVLEVANDELRTAQKQMVLLGRRTAKERLVIFLLDLAHQSRREGTSGCFFHVPMTRRDIADYLGLTIETVSRVLGQLKRSHSIELQGTHDIALRRADELAALIE